MRVNPIIPCLSKERLVVAPGVQEGRLEAPFPQDIAVEITERCFQGCRLCYGDFGQGEEMSWERVRAVMRAFDEANITTVHLTGGEPLWHSQIGTILRLFGEAGYKIEMDTNGVLVDEKMAGILASFGVEVLVGLDTLDPSVYHWYRGTDSLSRVLKGIDLMQERGMVPGIQAVMADFKGFNGGDYDPVKNIYSLVKSAVEKGVPVYLLDYRPSGRALSLNSQVTALSGEQRRELLDLLGTLPESQKRLVSGDLRFSSTKTAEYYGCLGGILWANMTSSGEVYLCNWTREKTYGNVFDEDLSHILERMRSQRLRGLEALSCVENGCDLVGKNVCFGPCLVSRTSLKMAK